MFVLDDELKKKYTEERLELEEAGLTADDYEKYQHEAAKLIAQVDMLMKAELKPLCEQYNLFAGIFGPEIIQAIRNLNYAFRVIDNIYIDGVDTPEKFKQDRMLMLKAIKRDYCPDDKSEDNDNNDVLF